MITNVSIINRKPTDVKLKFVSGWYTTSFLVKQLFLKTWVRRVDLHVLQNMSSGNRILSAFRFLSYPIKIINVIIHKHKISKSKDKKYAVIGVRTFNRKTSGQRSMILPPRQPTCDKHK